MDVFARGALIGFSIAAPLGPIGMLVLRQAFGRGMAAGLRCGLGAAVADLCYGALGTVGFTLVARWRAPTALAGGVLLLWLAWRGWHTPDETSAPPGEGFLSTFCLTLANPMTILSFTALVAGVGAERPVWFVAGVFAGSLAWWTLLSSLAATAGTRMSASARNWLKRATALVLLGFGVRAILSTVNGV